MNTFTPQVGIGVVGGNVPVFSDAKCTKRSSVFDLNGNPLRGNALVVSEGGVPPSFQSADSTVYFKHANGTVVSLSSAGASAVASQSGAVLPTVTLQVEGV